MRLSLWLVMLAAPVVMAGTKVSFNAQGNALVNSKPFFPIGCWVYSINPEVLADLREQHFNTVVGIGFKPDDVKALEDRGIMMIPPPSDGFLARKDSPSMLAWYLEDEPEEHGISAEALKKKYSELKKKDPDHPIGVTHDTLHGPAASVGACDFTMTDVYPVTRERDWPLNAVGMYTDGPRKLHGEGWPNFTFVQTFGGPDSDGGKWAQPLPHEVRFMVYDALVHRANGILYFSYWPRAQATWAEVGRLNEEIRSLTPWLAGDGEEKCARADVQDVEARAKKVEDSWMILVVNGGKREVDCEVTVEGLGDASLREGLGGSRLIKVRGGKWKQKLEGFGVKVYRVGERLSD